MLDSLYTTLFRPAESPVAPPMRTAWGIWFLISLLMAMGLAGSVSAGPWGLFGLTILVFGLNLLGWFWLSAATNLFAQVLGGKGAGEVTLAAIAQAFWPLILLAPLSALEPWLTITASVLSLAVLLWVLVGVVRAVSRAHGLSLGRAALVVVGAWTAVSLGIMGLFVAPILMILSAIG